ncbi:MAG: CooT family nickel-binding protein [Nitrososphaerota archaeon]|jgi:predicted RNA-binding protein|nr:CooT family nickel-binding protein [Nitrososphaerota archaeon]
MCEFNVILNDKTQIRDVIYAKMEDHKVVVKDIMGKATEFANCIISEVDVPNARLVLVQA